MKAVAGLCAALWAAALAAGAVRASAEVAAGRNPNIFHELLGRTDAETDRKIAATWTQLFHGADENQRIYFPAGSDEAYIADIANRDVRTEGLSYGMMIAIQLDHRAEFDRIWKWARTRHYHAEGPLRGYFAWHADFHGRMLDPGPAPDGEEWIATALFFAAHRWGSGAGIFDYEAEAQALLHTMLHKGEEPGAGNVTSMFDRAEAQIVFAPGAEAARFTDPSYHLPAFYELWARWAAAPADRIFWARAAAASRVLFRKAANPETGLMPDYAEFDGRPHPLRGHGDFRFDAWRTLSNPALDWSWFRADPWAVAQSNRVLRFMARQGPDGANQFTLDGTPLSHDHSIGLTAMAATAGLAADSEMARPLVQELWSAPIPEGTYRYYDGLMYFLGLLQCGGRFHAYEPATH